VHCQQHYIILYIYTNIYKHLCFFRFARIKHWMLKWLMFTYSIKIYAQLYFVRINCCEISRCLYYITINNGNKLSSYVWTISHPVQCCIHKRRCSDLYQNDTDPWLTCSYTGNSHRKSDTNDQDTILDLLTSVHHNLAQTTLVTILLSIFDNIDTQ